MKKTYITPSVECRQMLASELLNTVSGVISNNDIRYGGVDETGELDPSAKGREALTDEELEQLQNTNEWEQGLW